jgi:enoyl-CoA hydratase/carnithine racemase
MREGGRGVEGEPLPDRVILERDRHVLLIGVNRPEKRNAFDLATIEQLAAAYDRLAAERELRVGVLFGHGDHFSAGLDLGEMGPAVAERGPGALAGPGRYDPFGVWGPQVPKPIVMAVQGIAFTLSIELALASDIVIAADDVRFGQLEIARGIMPFGGATFRAPAQLGWGNAMRFLLTADEFGAEQAMRIGLVQETVPAGAQFDRAAEVARRIAAQAPLGVQATLANARVARAAAEQTAVEHLRETVPRVLRSADAVEGLRSFLERRAGDFTGE